MITEIDGHKIKQEHFMYRGYLIILTTEELCEDIVRLKAGTSNLGVLKCHKKWITGYPEGW
jgi:hypothetical protein